MNKRFFFLVSHLIQSEANKNWLSKANDNDLLFIIFFLLDRGKQSSLLQAEFIFTDIYLLWRCMNDSLFCYM